MTSIVLFDEFQSLGTVQLLPEVRKIVFSLPPPVGMGEVLRYILYPVMGEPPSLAGAIHDRDICSTSPVALREVGASGAVATKDV